MDSLRLIGKSTDYRVPYKSIHRIFAIPKIDDMHVQLILGLDPPIRQGATRYPFLVAQMPQDEHTDAELNIEEYVVVTLPWIALHDCTGARGGCRGCHVDKAAVAAREGARC